ncbi:MAG: glutamate-cysteine ligase family protein [Desulfonatronovibrio sp.]
MQSHIYPTLGVEMEMPIARALDGTTYPVDQYFKNLQKLWKSRHASPGLLKARGQVYGLTSPAGLHSLDNAYNNLESSLGPVDSGPHSLDALCDLVKQELGDVDQTLALEQAMVINFSEHPRVNVDEEFYYRVRAPRSIYDYQIQHRGWNHMSGFDAKAHNSPSTGISLDQSIAGLNCLLALAPAFIALYANSPFEGGKITGFKENRLKIWNRQMNSSRMTGDRKLHCPPPEPFRNLAHYLTWMFGPGTQMWFAHCRGQGKDPGDMYLIPGNPCLLDFLRAGEQLACPAGGGAPKTVVPGMDNLAYHQFAQYTDCRLRYGLKDHGPDIKSFLHILDNHPDRLEEFLAPHLSFCYLEGRSAGANFADMELTGLDMSEIPASVAVSPSAVQAGLLRNLDKARKLTAEYAWKDLLGLRMETARLGLDAEYGGIRARELCARVLETAGQGLDAEQAWMLDYPLWVLRTGKTGADRALKRFDQLKGSAEKRLSKLILERRMIPA